MDPISLGYHGQPLRTAGRSALDTHNKQLYQTNLHSNLGGDDGESNPLENNSTFDVWNSFFLSAGIPNQVANEYALTFSQHRIKIDMLKDITKEILIDMNIKAMGDIIAILRHAKSICAQNELKGFSGMKQLSSGPSQLISTNKVINLGQTQRNQFNNTPSGSYISSGSNNNMINHKNDSSLNGSIKKQNSPHAARSSVKPIQIVNQAASMMTTKSTNQPTSLAAQTSGNKIQSRLSLSSGAFRAANSPSVGLSNNSNSNKRLKPPIAQAPSSSSSSSTLDTQRQTNSSTTTLVGDGIILPESLAKRMRPAPSQTAAIDPRFTEKTLTVILPNTTKQAPTQMGPLKQVGDLGERSVRSRLGPPEMSRVGGIESGLLTSSARSRQVDLRTSLSGKSSQGSSAPFSQTTNSSSSSSSPNHSSSLPSLSRQHQQQRRIKQASRDEHPLLEQKRPASRQVITTNTNTKASNYKSTTQQARSRPAIFDRLK